VTDRGISSPSQKKRTRTRNQIWRSTNKFMTYLMRTKKSEKNKKTPASRKKATQAHIKWQSAGQALIMF
jgi:hypothetical protein